MLSDSNVRRINYQISKLKRSLTPKRFRNDRLIMLYVEAYHRGTKPE